MTDRRGVLLAELKREHRAGRVFLSNYRYHATPKVLLGCKATIKILPLDKPLASSLAYQAEPAGSLSLRGSISLPYPLSSSPISLFPPYDLSPLLRWIDGS